jgi:hypothetical protein
VDRIPDRLRFAPLMDINLATSCPLVWRSCLISVFVHRLARLIHRRQRRIRERNCCEKTTAEVFGGREVLGKAVKKPDDLSKNHRHRARCIMMAGDQWFTAFMRELVGDREVTARLLDLPFWTAGPFLRAASVARKSGHIC